MNILIGFLATLVLTSFSAPLYASEGDTPSPIQFSVSPDSAYQLLIQHLSQAQKSIWINIYEMDHPEIYSILLDKISQKIELKILIEGQPVGGLTSATAGQLHRLQAAWKKFPNPQSGLWIMKSSPNYPLRRFRYDHAKYIIVDQSNVLVSSENFKTGAFPEGLEVGNRGWQIAYQNRDLAQALSQIWLQDSAQSSHDVIQIGNDDPILASTSSRDSTPFTQTTLPRTWPRVAPSQGVSSAFELITSPSSDQKWAELLSQAKHQIRIEQMSLPPTWRLSGNQGTITNPLVGAIILAAKHGVSAQVLLNDERVFGGDPNIESANQKTVAMLRRASLCQGLPIEARIVDTKKLQISYIHNKGAIIDDKIALVSSINGTRTSVLFNREVGLATWSEQAARYFSSVFDFDWNESLSDSTDESYAQIQCETDLPDYLFFGPSRLTHPEKVTTTPLFTSF